MLFCPREKRDRSGLTSSLAARRFAPDNNINKTWNAFQRHSHPPAQPGQLQLGLDRTMTAE